MLRGYSCGSAPHSPHTPSTMQWPSGWPMVSIRWRPCGAVAAFGLRRTTRRQVPLHAVALTTGDNLAARPHDRPPEHALGDRRCGWFGLCLGRGPLAAAVRGGFDRGCSHDDAMVHACITDAGANDAREDHRRSRSTLQRLPRARRHFVGRVGEDLDRPPRCGRSDTAGPSSTPYAAWRINSPVTATGAGRADAEERPDRAAA